MALRPDYGLRLRRDGYQSRTTLHFYRIPLGGFEMLASGQYSFTVDKMHAGERHCVSFDFGADILAAILSALPPPVAHAIGSKLSETYGRVVSVKFDPITCEHVSATLGDLQNGHNEVFVPLVINEMTIKPQH